MVPDGYFAAACGFMAILPTLVLLWRIKTAKKLNERHEIVVGEADDHRDHLVVYLFVMLLPLYPNDLGSWREMSAALVALLFVAFIFWHLNLHYMNVLFALFGYRVFSVLPLDDSNPLSGRVAYVLITRRVSIASGQHVIAHRLSDTVFMEV